MRILLRVRGARIERQLAEHVRSRANLALGRLSSYVRSVLVRLEDLNGPKGGIDKRCSIELAGTFGQRVAEVRDQSFGAAIDRAFSIAQRGLVRDVKRKAREFGNGLPTTASAHASAGSSPIRARARALRADGRSS